MKELFIGAQESNQKEVAIRAIKKAQKGLAGFFGVKRASIRFNQENEHGPWKLKIDGSNDLGIRMHSTGALETSKVNGDETVWKRIASAAELRDIYYEKNKDRDGFRFKFNKKKFEPNEFVLQQVQFIGEEKNPNKSIWKKATEYGRKFVREMTQNENALGFLAGGAGVILVNALAAGNVDAAMALKDVMVHSNKYVALASAALTGMHPLLYLAETKFGKDPTNRKSMKNLRRATNFFAMIGWGATITEGTIGVISNLDEPESKGVEAHTELKEKDQSLVEDVPNVNTPLSSEDTDANILQEEPQTQSLYPRSDFEATQILDSHYHEELKTGDWQNPENGQDLSNVILDKTFEYLANNGLNVHEVDLNKFFENRGDYLNGDQIANLDNIASTKTYDEYLNYLRNN